jgi:hypothetical protein
MLLHWPASANFGTLTRTDHSYRPSTHHDMIASSLCRVLSGQVAKHAMSMEGAIAQAVVVAVHVLGNI